MSLPGFGLTPLQVTIETPDPVRPGDPDPRRWSRLAFRGAFPAGRWIRLVYEMSLFARLGRPILRFETPDGPLDRPIQAPLFGRGQWTGRIPDTATAARICLATGDIGALRLLSCHRVSLARLVEAGLRQSAVITLDTFWIWLTGRPALSRRRFATALESTPLDRYARWRRDQLRATDLAGIDRPGFDWSTGPHILFVVAATDAGSPARLAATLGSLERQVYPNCSIVVFDGSTDLEALAHRDGTPVVIAPLAAGDTLPDHAAACVAEAIAAHPEIEAWYADSDALSETGDRTDPRLKPDWSPVFDAASGYAIDAVYFRSVDAASVRDLLAPATRRAALAALAPSRVGHIRRVLLTRAAATPAPPAASPAQLPGGTVRSPVSVIIPSKDRVELLRKCIDSIALNPGLDIETIVVDNGSTEPGTWAYYDSLPASARVRVISSPGPFNFSALCNLGAADARGETLVFLNNDTWAHDTDWLAPLVRWARQPGIGAVGPKMSYPSGSLQHAGIVIGLHGLAAHIDSGLANGSNGYLDRYGYPREVSAVTGACLAVTADKFHKVGGFDAVAFPVEFNDIDLCLRLGAAGWRTLCTPETVIFHEESATRGADPSTRQLVERERFRDRWGLILADDPAFHPALSLQSSHTMLG